MKPKNTLNVFNRALAIWKPDFLSVLVAEKRSKPTWAFWFLWNTIFTLFITVMFVIFLQKSTMELENEWWPTIQDFEITLDDGVLSTNLNEPIVFDEEAFIFVLDTQEKEYDQSVLDTASSGIFINGDRFIAKDGDKYKTTEFPFSEIKENFTFTKSDATDWYEEYKGRIKTYVIVFAAIGIWFFLAIFRLLSAVWWALLAWAAGSIFKIKDWSFGTSYLLILNLYFIPFIIELILGYITFLYIPFSTFIILAVMLWANFSNYKNDK